METRSTADPQIPLPSLCLATGRTAPALLASAPLLIDSINADSKVRLVMHVGDIHSGSMPCTGAGLNPIPATANPGWNQGIFNLFEEFKDPVIYTPGDNEWTDCHKTKQG